MIALYPQHEERKRLPLLECGHDFSTSTMRILIIEDEQNIGRFLRDSLEAECFAIDLATDGEEGSYLGRTNDYDLIIIDNVLPKKSGIEICRELRAEGKTAPILILSALTESARKIDLPNAGADDYLTKPFALAELLARIRALLRRPLMIETEVITVGDIVLDTRSCTVKRGKRDIYLTRKEFMLLQYLMKNRGIVLSRGMILEHVWDMSTDIFSNSIESHIVSLRKKLGDARNKQGFIQTVPGRGYRVST
jgi:DNA-binding response OmpR family regulator